MGLGGNVAAGVSGNVNLIAFAQQVKAREHHASFGPQASQDDLAATKRGDGLAEILVDPGVDARTIDDGEVGKEFRHLGHERTRERVLGYGGDQHRELEELRCFGENLNVMHNAQAIVGLNALIHGGLKVDQHESRIVGAQHFKRVRGWQEKLLQERYGQAACYLSALSLREKEILLSSKTRFPVTFLLSQSSSFELENSHTGAFIPLACLAYQHHNQIRDVLLRR